MFVFFSSIIRDQQVACCLWGRFAEQMLYTSKVAQVNQNFLCLLRFAKINVYKGKISTKCLTNIYIFNTTLTPFLNFHPLLQDKFRSQIHLILH